MYGTPNVASLTCTWLVFCSILLPCNFYLHFKEYTPVLLGSASYFIVTNGENYLKSVVCVSRSTVSSSRFSSSETLIQDTWNKNLIKIEHKTIFRFGYSALNELLKQGVVWARCCYVHSIASLCYNDNSIYATSVIVKIPGKLFISFVMIKRFTNWTVGTREMTQKIRKNQLKIPKNKISLPSYLLKQSLCSRIWL